MQQTVNIDDVTDPADLRKARNAESQRRRYWRRKADQDLFPIPLTRLLVAQALVRSGWLAARDVSNEEKVLSALTKLVEGVLMVAMNRETKKPHQ